MRRKGAFPSLAARRVRPSPTVIDSAHPSMTTIIAISAAVGAALGAWLGWKAGRGFERVRPTRKKSGRPEQKEK